MRRFAKSAPTNSLSWTAWPVKAKMFDPNLAWFGHIWYNEVGTRGKYLYKMHQGRGRGGRGGAKKVGVIPLYEDDQLDIVEGTDEEGNKVLLQVMEYFFYNGEEYVVLGAAEESDEEACEECDCEACGHEEGHEHETDLYIMKVLTSTDDSGEEVEEFVPVDEDLMDKLIQVVQTNFSEDDDEEDPEDEEEE